MCILFFAHGVVPGRDVLLVHNRDEFAQRETAAAAWWTDHPDIYGGRDLERGGTWFAVHRSGKFAALTNFREAWSNHMLGKKSRGQVLTDFLQSSEHPYDYLKRVAEDVDSFNGFNVLCGDLQLAAGGGPCAWYFGTHHSATEPLPLERGRVYGLSNAVLDEPWHKVELGKQMFTDLAKQETVTEEEILCVMRNQDGLEEEDPRLPDTGVSPRSESAFSSIFVRNRGIDFNTRCTCILSAAPCSEAGAGASFQVSFSEWTYPDAHPERFEHTSTSFTCGVPSE